MKNDIKCKTNDNALIVEDVSTEKKETKDCIAEKKDLKYSNTGEKFLLNSNKEKKGYIKPSIYIPKNNFKKRRGYLFFKRCFDLISSFFALILLSPLILICLLIKWLEDFHNPIYISKRVGKDGKLFTFYKIRTMRAGAEEMKEDLNEQGLNEANGPVFKIKDDPRVTKVGRFYRKFSLDELPQLINVLNGTMSVVGPRPPLLSEVEKYTDYQKLRLTVKGGLLCFWQITKNRNSLLFDEWVKLDLEYIEHRSIWLDLKIIFKGAWMVVFDHSGE